MKWFKHFSNAHDSNDLTKVRLRYGADGYAIYWYCLELIAGDLGNDEEITFELKHDAEVVGLNLKIDTARVEEIMAYMVRLGLFERSNSMITCFKLAKYLDKKSTRNSTIQRIIDSTNMSETVADKSGQVGTLPDESGRSGLDIDTDTDIDTEKKKKKKTPHADACEVCITEIKKHYPKRAGGQRWAEAERALRARMKEGHTADEILSGVDRYRAYCEGKEIVGSEYVQQAATFLGRNKGFQETWTAATKQPKKTDLTKQDYQGDDPEKVRWAL